MSIYSETETENLEFKRGLSDTILQGGVLIPELQRLKHHLKKVKNDRAYDCWKFLVSLYYQAIIGKQESVRTMVPKGIRTKCNI